MDDAGSFRPMKTIHSVSFALLSTTLVATSVGSVSAASNSDIAASLLEHTSRALGINLSDQQLIQTLTDDLEYAIEDGAVPSDVVDDIEGSLDSGTDPESVDDSLEENITDDIANWEEVAPLYRQAFDTVRADFQACRASSGSASGCARGLGFKMQIAIATDSLARLQLLEQQLTDSGVVLTDEQRAALEAEKAELLAKIDRAQEKLSALDSADPAVVEAKKAMERIHKSVETIRSEVPPGSSGSTPANNGNGQPGGNGNSGSSGNSGGQGNGNGNGHSGGQGNSGQNGNGSNPGRGRS